MLQAKLFVVTVFAFAQQLASAGPFFLPRFADTNQYTVECDVLYKPVPFRILGEKEIEFLDTKCKLVFGKTESLGSQESHDDSTEENYYELLLSTPTSEQAFPHPEIDDVNAYTVVCNASKCKLVPWKVAPVQDDSIEENLDEPTLSPDTPTSGEDDEEIFRRKILETPETTTFTTTG